VDTRFISRSRWTGPKRHEGQGDLSTAIEAGLVRTAEDALTVLRQASQPLGLMGAERLQRQERDL
jgi:hypothetical protein